VRHPLLLVLALSLAFTVSLTPGASATGSGGWSPLATGRPNLPALNGAVYALTAADENDLALYIGGAFTQAAGEPIAHIARWNGYTLQAVGHPALNGDVHAIAAHASKIYVGGAFTNAGGNSNADFLAVWDGVSWKPFCNGSAAAFNGSVAALQVIGSTLYVGGSFSNAASIPSADFLVACNLNTGTASSLVTKDGDINGGVYALTADSHGTLYAAGQFINMAGIPAADHVAAYSGGQWHAMGSGPTSLGGGAVEDYVRSITAFENNVYIGTDALNVAGIPQADHVAKWNGSAWSAMGSSTGGANGWFPTSAFIYGMTTVGSRVFVTGSFQNANGDPQADNIAEFDPVGGVWQAVGSNGAGNGPWIGNGLALGSLFVSGPAGSGLPHLLVAGGSFTAAGGDTHATYAASRPL
jgi:hypothetical protein